MSRRVDFPKDAVDRHAARPECFTVFRNTLMTISGAPSNMKQS